MQDSNVSSQKPGRLFSWEQRLKDLWVPEPGKIVMDLTDEWFLARRGRITASSRANILLNDDKKKWNEALIGVTEELDPDYEKGEDKGNKYMKWGRDHEDEALANLELKLGVELHHPGFLLSPNSPFIGGTPDGVTADRKVSVQIKCPYFSRNHLKFFYDRTLTPQYYTQVQVEAAVLGAERIIFASYDPRQPLSARVADIEVKVSSEIIDKLYSRVVDFADMLETGRLYGVGKLGVQSGIPELF